MASDRYPADLIARRTRARATSAPRPRNDMPRPEDVFLAWLCSLPEGADIAAAARRAVARIERRAPLRPELQRLRDLFLEAKQVVQRCRRTEPDPPRTRRSPR